MSEPGKNSRPRRAMDPDEEFNLEDPNGPDDTPADLPSPARRGADPVDDEPVNPFARPGSQSASVPVGRRGGAVSDDESRPVPRRSAVSSLTPPDPDVMIPAPSSGSVPVSQGTPAGASWVEHHRRTLTIWVIGALVAAVLIAGGSYLARRAVPPEPPHTDSPTPTATATDSTTPEPSLPPAVVEDLMTVEDAELMVPGASWVVTATAEERADFEAIASCLSGDDGGVNTLASLQRTLGTSEADHLAAMHQIDVYASEEAAQQVQAARVAQLTACDQVPVHIQSATVVTGLGDDVTQLTVAYENAPAEVHSVWLVRTADTLTTVDVVRDATAVAPEAVAAGMLRSLGQLCGAAGGACPATPAFAPAIPPPSPPNGWLLTSDLPRITPGTGQWTSTEPGPLTSVGMGCENIPLATEPGPAARFQRTYLLLQDAGVPATFGVDEMVFDFNAEADAATFVGRLGGNLASCKDRVLTAAVTEHSGATGTAADGTAISSRLFTIQQATSDDSSVIYQVSVAVTGTKVSYLLTSVTEEFKFSDAQFAALALRTGQRLSQH